MPTSQARIDANRMNSARSTGPTSEAGKNRSRANSLKHGLTGAGIVVAEQDVAEVEIRAAAFMAELDPKSSLGKILVGQMATLSVRMERGAQQEEEALASRVRHATDAFDHDRIDRVEDLFNGLADAPRANLRYLRRSPEGVDRLLEAWDELREVLMRSTVLTDWDDTHHAMIAHLVGRRLDQARGTQTDELSLAIRDLPCEINDLDYLTLGIPERRLWARDRLVEQVDREIAKLEEHHESLDHEAIELDRLGAPDMALFDSSPAASRARRYESEARRGFFKAMAELRKVEAEAAQHPAPKPVPTPAPASLGSFCAGDSPLPREPKPAVAEPFERSNFVADGAARGLDGRVLAVGRAPVMTGAGV